MRMKKRALVTAVIALAVVCGLLAAVTGLEHLQNEKLQKIKLQEAQESYGSYNEESIVLSNTTPRQAEALAELLQARLRMTADGSYAVLYLPEGVTPQEVYANDAYKPYLSAMSLDYYVDTEAVDANNNTLISSRPSVPVSDPLYSQQDYLDYVNLQDTWNVSTGAGVVVAVIDSGIDTDHPDFAGKISYRSYDASNDKVVETYGMSVIEDYDGHGTSVAGVIAAGMNDGIGITGIAPNVELIVIKCETDGKGRFLRGSDLVFGLAYAIECDADVVNMSFGTNTNEFARYTQLAVDSDIICVAAAGNEGSAMPMYPAADEHVIGVGALDTASWSLAHYSNYGFSLLLAPGTAYTTDVGGGYRSATGTSISCPVVTSAVALYLSRNPYTEFEEMCELLKASSIDLGILGEDRQHAFGALDIYALVCEEKGTITYEMLTDELRNQTQIFVKDHTIQYMPEPERSDVVLDGWYYDMECTDEVAYFETVFAEDVTVYASWINEDDGTAYTYRNLSDGTVEIVSYTGRRRYLTIPAILEGKTVSSIGEYAFSGNSRLRSVTLPDTLKNIGEGAFYECVNIRAIEIPTSVLTIGKQAFYGCVSLSQVGLMRSGNLQVIGDQAFAMCGISSIHLPKTVKNLGSGVFYGSFGITSVTVEPGNTSYQIKNNALYNAAGTSLIYYPAALSGSYTIAGGTKVVENYAFAYSRCSSIVLNDDIQELGFEAFSNTNIRSIVIPSGVTLMRECCFEGSKLEEVTFRSGSSLSEISMGTFRWCPNLTGVVIPKGVNTIGEAAFSGSGLKTLSFEQGSSLESIGQGAFSGCDLVSVVFPDSLMEIGWAAFDSCRKLQSVTWTSGSKLQKIGPYAFASCSGLKEILFPESLKQVDYCAFSGSGLEKLALGKNLTTLGDGAFSACQNLQSIQVASENTAYQSQNGVVFSKDGTVLYCFPAGRGGSYQLPANTVRIADYAFADAKNLTDVVLNEGLDEICGFAFSGCEMLSTPQLPATLTTIGENAFEYCTSMSGTLTIPKNVISIGRFAFFDDYALTEIVIEPESKLTRISNSTFGYCGITNFTVPRSVSSLGQEVFVGCKNLLTVTFESESELQAIAAWTFSGAEELRQITFEEGSQLQLLEARSLEGLRKLERITLEYCTQLKTIDNYAFQNCSSLTEISLPATLEEIGRYAFNGCSSLSQLSLADAVQFIGRYAFNRTNGMNIYFSGNVLPLYLEENWDYGIYGYYTATEEVVTSGNWRYALSTDGKASIIAYTGSQSNITLSTIDGHEIVSIGGYAFADNTSLESIVLPDTIQGIYQYAFKGTTALQSVLIPKNVAIIENGAFQGSGVYSVTFAPGSALVTLGRYVFADTPNLLAAAIPDGVQEIRDYAFRNSSVQEVTFGSTTALTKIGRYAFLNSGLKHFTLPAGVTLIDDGAFRGCTALTSVDLSKANQLQISANAFYGAGLTSVEIPAGVQYIGEFCFAGCTGLKDITVAADNKNYASESGILYNKAKTKLITCPAGKTGSITVPATVSTLGFAAFEGSRLSDVIFPQNSALVTLGYRVFYNCDNLKSIAIPDGVQSIDNYAFAECNNLKTVTFTANSQLGGIYKGAFYNNTSLTSISIPKGVQEIGDYAFYGCDALTKVQLSENSLLKGVYDYAFAYSGITEFVMPDGLLEIGTSAFQGSQLKTLVCNDDVVEIGDYAFADCSLEKTRVLEFPASVAYLGYGALKNVTGVEELTIPFLGTSQYLANPIDEAKLGTLYSVDQQMHNGVIPLRKITVLSGNTVGSFAFAGCQELKQINLPDTVTEIGYRAFSQTTFKEITLPKSLVTLHANAFDISKVEKVVFPDGLETIGESCFEQAISLVSVDIPDSVRYIGDNAFRSTDLREVHLPASVAECGNAAFSGCKNLERITVEEGNPYYTAVDGILYTADMSKLISAPAKKGGTIIVPEGVEEIGWNAFYSSRLTQIKLPDSLKRIERGAFFSCSELRSVEIPDSVEYVETQAFSHCERLRTASLNASMKEIPYGLFENCGNLETVIMPEGITSLGENAFSYAGLKEIQIPSTLVTIGNGAFNGCNSLEAIYVDAQNPSYASKDGLLYDKAFEKLIVAPKSISGTVTVAEGVKVLGTGAFQGCMQLETIILPDSLERIEQSCFRLCDNLKQVEIGSGVTYIGQSAFQETGLFYDAKNWENGLLYIGQYLVWCNGQNDFGDLPQLPDKVVRVREGTRLLAECCFIFKDIEHVYLPDSVQYINQSAFGSCSSLKTVRMSKNVKVMEDHAFGDDSGLHSIDLTGVKNIYWSLGGCTGLEYAVLGDSVANLCESYGLKCVVVNNYRRDLEYCLVPDRLKLVIANNDISQVEDAATTFPEIYTYVENVDDAHTGNSRVYGKDEWYMATFYANGCIITMEPTLVGEVVQAPANALMQEYLWFGSEFLGWDINGDGVVDELPTTLVEDLQAHAVVKMPISSISILETETTMEVTDEKTLRVSYSPSYHEANGELVWTSSNEAVATVDETGKVTAVAEGAVTITATLKENSEVSASIELYIIPLTYGIRLQEEYGALKPGETKTLTPRFVLPEGDTNTTSWFSWDESVATVDQNGTITAIAPGETGITIVHGDYSASYMLSVVVHMEGVHLEAETDTINVGERLNIKLVLEPENATDQPWVTWSSSDENIATVDGGRVVAHRPGQVIICATANEFEAELMLTVKAPLEWIVLNTTVGTMRLDRTKQLEVIYEPSGTTDNKNVVWSSSDPQIASVSDTGLVTAHKRGTAVITGQVGNLSATYTVTVIGLRDTTTGIIVTNANDTAMRDAVELDVSQVDRSGMENSIQTQISSVVNEDIGANNTWCVYDITLMEYGQAIQPDTLVDVEIPFREDMDQSNFKIYRVETDGSLTDMTAEFENSNACFETDHFSMYVLAAQKKDGGKPGDINGDGKVNNKDATRLFQYLAGWAVEVDASCLDVNGDGKVNNKDATRLFQYLAGWAVELR